MKKIISSAIFSVMALVGLQAQNVGITDNGSTFTPDASSVLEMQSTSRGVLIPRLSTAQRTGIGTPATGLMVYDTDTKSIWYYDVDWKEIISTYNINTNAPSSIYDTDGNTKIQTEESDNENKIRFDTDGSERMVIDQSGNITLGDGTNQTKIESDGSLTFEGNATVYNDLMVPVTSSKDGGSKSPGFAKVKDNGSSSQGVFTYWFSPTSEEELYFNVQMPHSWKEGSDIFPHVHWIAPTAPGATYVTWGLEYTWTNIGSTFGNTSILTAHTPIDAVGTIDAYEHVITALGTITGTGKTISSMLICRVYRVAADANDTYTDDAGLLQIDFHYEIDASGSHQEYTK